MGGLLGASGDVDVELAMPVEVVSFDLDDTLWSTKLVRRLLQRFAGLVNSSSGCVLRVDTTVSFRVCCEYRFLSFRLVFTSLRSLYRILYRMSKKGFPIGVIRGERFFHVHASVEIFLSL